MDTRTTAHEPARRSLLLMHNGRPRGGRWS